MGLISSSINSHSRIYPLIRSYSDDDSINSSSGSDSDDVSGYASSESDSDDHVVLRTCDPFDGASAPPNPANEQADYNGTFREEAYSDALAGLAAHARIHGNVDDLFTPVKPIKVTELRQEEVSRIKAIRMAFISPAASSCSSSSCSSSSSGNQSLSLLNVRQGGFLNTNNYNLSICSNNSNGKKDDGMSALARGALFLAGAVIVVAGNIFLGKSQKLVREAKEDLEYNAKGTNHPVRQTLNRIDKQIIAITREQQKLASFGVVAAVGAIAAGVFASYTLMWASLVGGVVVLAVTARKYFAGEIDLSTAIRKDYDHALETARQDPNWKVLTRQIS